jgi:translation initiation factor IF-1
MGGCNGKKVAHKHAVKSTKSGLRISQNKSEIYGVVKRLNGNTFDVTCIDDKERRCFIRGKFKGRGKRDNIIEVDKWVLVGLREFQQVPSELVLVNGKKEMEMCDLLEVYSSSEKETLKRTHGVYMKESEFSRPAATASEDALQFVDMDTLRYQKIASQKVETIRINAEQRKTSNNVVDQSAFYSDIGSDGDDSSDDDRESGEDEENNNNKNNKIGSSSESEEEESEEEESEEEESEEEESEEEEKSKTEKQNNWNKNKRVYKEEIDVDDI